MLLTYKNSNTISSIIDELKNSKPTVEFSSETKEKHRLWKIENDKKLEKIQSLFKKIPSLYIGDGHHRSASSVLLSEENKDLKNNTNASDYFMAFLIPENELKIQEYNRVVTDLNGYSNKEFLDALKQYFNISPQENGKIPDKKHSLTMYLKGQFYCVSLQDNTVFKNSPLYQLDTHILQELILKPILGITDIRNNIRLDYS